ncbi:hypothetical protein MUU72_23165 [Streptomyces sp. RS10V-4]|uniref:hypothetical protein n=1 Tax=Streptomyces rhizoryzae TaxID=2932493 RepID=UPI0020043828|nr:hypothetical protein [Streptomyces rhizoryzae]MCK7625967.1 hypothetical protein [Streptomyces rhizoryzae]
MSSGHKTVTALLALIGALILVIVGLVAAWPMWVWPVAAVLLAGTALLTARALAPKAGPYLPPEELLPLPRVSRQEQRVTDVALPSAVADYDFLFSATVRWDILDPADDAPHVNPGGLAVDAVLERARAITALEQPHRSSLVQHQLNGALGTMRHDASGRVAAMAADVTLSLSPRDQERLDKLSKVRKDEDLWKHERKYELDRRSYLGEDVLKDPGRAVVWWLAKNNDHIEETVDRIGVLAQLSAAANNREVPEPFRAYVEREPDTTPTPSDEDEPSAPFIPRPSGAHPLNGAPVGDYLNGLMHAAGVTEPGTSAIARRFANILETDGYRSAAEEIRRRFVPAAPTADDPTPDAGTGT